MNFGSAMATLAAPGLGFAPSSFFSSRPQCGLSPCRSLGASFGGELMRRAVTSRSRPWRTAAACRALKSNSDEIATPSPPFVPDQPQIFYFAIANAQSLMLEGARLEVVLQNGIERAESCEVSGDRLVRYSCYGGLITGGYIDKNLHLLDSRAKRPKDVWLVMEPAFLNEHPGLKALNVQLAKPTAAILSTNADWMLSFVKKSLPQAVIGKFTSPSTAVPDPLKSNLNANSDVVGGGGVWH